MASISFIADICSTADDAVERLNEVFLLSHPQADEQEHRQLVATALWEVEGEWRARRMATEGMMRDNLRLGWELESPEPNEAFILQPRVLRNYNYDRRPNPQYGDQSKLTSPTQPMLLPFRRPIQRTMRVLEEDIAKPLPPSPPSSPRAPPRAPARMVRYNPPAGQFPRQPLIFSAQEIKQEPREEEAYLQPNAISRVPIPPGNPGAAFRANPARGGIKMSTRQGFRRHLANKCAVKSSEPY